jgi:predicted ferric reductase
MLIKKNIGWIAVVVISLSPLIFWSFALLPFYYRFYNIYSAFTSLGEMTGLVGMTMFSLNLVLSARLELFEDYFGGMNRVYVAHHIFGGVAFIILLIHPLLLSFARASISLKVAAALLLPGEDWTINFGITSILLMITLLVITFFISLHYQVWKFTHKFLGAVFFLAAIHGLFVSSDIARNAPLRNYMLLIIIAGMLGYLYRTIFGKYMVKKEEYTINEVSPLEDNVVQISMTPKNKKAKVIAGQFVFVNFKSAGVSNEVHPFSISAVDENGDIALSIKASGDFTSTLKNLQVGEKAYIEGGYGRFSYQRYKNKQQIWIAGGIGIAPFLSMATDIKLVDYLVDLYYTVHEEKEAVYLTDLLQLAQSKTNFRVIPYVSKTQGRLSADIVAKTSGGDITKKDIFLCGPPPMMKSLRAQFNKLGVQNQNIHSEEFSMYD